MSPLNLRFECSSYSDPSAVYNKTVHTLNFKIDCPDGSTHGRLVKVSGEKITPEELSFVAESINEMWTEHSRTEHEHIYDTKPSSGKVGEMSSEDLRGRYQPGTVLYRQRCSVCGKEKEWADVPA